jgi:hypothetical protein
MSRSLFSNPVCLPSGHTFSQLGVTGPLMTRHQQRRTPELSLAEVRATGIFFKAINQMVTDAPDGALIKVFRFQ